MLVWSGVVDPSKNTNIFIRVGYARLIYFIYSCYDAGENKMVPIKIVHAPALSRFTPLQ